MCEPVTLIGLGISAASSIAEGVANARTADHNAFLANLAAKDSERRGGIAAGRIRQEGSHVVGEQRVAYAAAGVDPSSGSAALAAADTRARAELDALTAENNAAREAWGYRSQRDDFKAQGEQSVTRGLLNAGSGLLTGTSNILGRNKVR